MKCRDPKRIVVNKHYAPTKTDKTPDEPIVGLDTETVGGKAFIISISTVREDYVVRVRSWSDVVGALMPLAGASVFCWNLGFDERALLAHLPPDTYRYILEHGEGPEKRLRLIPDKHLQVTTPAGKVDLFDAAQHYDHLPLKEAALLVGESKIIQDVTALDPDRYDSDKAYQELLDEYAKADARICRKLAVKAAAMYGPYRPRKWYSLASPAKRAWEIHHPDLRGKPPSIVMMAALEAYHGGRFEVYKRGSVERVVTHDLRSAYPWAMSTIPSTSHGTWRRGYSDDEQALIRILKIKGEGGGYAGPLPVHHPKGVIYPVGKVEGWYMAEDVDCARLAGWTVEVKESWLYYDDEPVYPWKFLADFYYEKERRKKGDPARESYKKILNSMYGCTIQTTPYRMKPVEKEGLVDDAGVVDGRHVAFECEYKAGVMYDPVTAALVTAKTRKKLFKEMLAAGPGLVGVATDSITVMEAYDRVVDAPGLGEWSLESPSRDVVVVGSGLSWDVGAVKSKARGLVKRLDPAVFESDGPSISIDLKRVVRAKAALDGWHLTTNEGELELSPADINRFVVIKKEVSLNSDWRRVWERDFKNTHELKTTRIDSAPMVVE